MWYGDADGVIIGAGGVFGGRWAAAAPRAAVRERGSDFWGPRPRSPPPFSPPPFLCCSVVVPAGEVATMCCLVSVDDVCVATDCAHVWCLHDM